MMLCATCAVAVTAIQFAHQHLVCCAYYTTHLDAMRDVALTACVLDSSSVYFAFADKSITVRYCAPVMDTPKRPA